VVRRPVVVDNGLVAVLEAALDVAAVGAVAELNVDARVEDLRRSSRLVRAAVWSGRLREWIVPAEGVASTRHFVVTNPVVLPSSLAASRIFATGEKSGVTPVIV
jgi:hypothetical protein